MKTRCVRENFFSITNVKMKTCVREKYNILFQWNLVKFIFFLYPWKEKIVSVKIITISLYPVQEKENPPLKISKNASVKKLECPWKSVKKCAWKPLNVSWKKSKKARKRLSRALFIFSGKKVCHRLTKGLVIIIAYPIT